MRNFVKKLAFVMAIAMVLMNFGPAITANASTKTPSLKFTVRVLYLNEGGSIYPDAKGVYYTDSCWVPTQDIGNYKATYVVTEGKDIVTVNTKGRVTAIGDKLGKAVVTITYDNGDGKPITAKFGLRVRRNAVDVRLRETPLKDLNVKEDNTAKIDVGTKVDLSSVKSYVKNDWSTSVIGYDNWMTNITDQVEYKTSDEKVLKLTGNVLEAVGAGEATLTVFTYQFGDEDKKVTAEKTYTVTVADNRGMLTVEQTALTTLKLVFGSNLETKPAISDFVITQTDIKMTIPIYEVTYDKNVVTVKTFAPMADGGNYSIRYIPEEKELPFVATDGVVTQIKVDKERIPFDTETKVVIELTDNEDVVISTVNFLGNERTDINVEYTKGNGYTYDNIMLLLAKGDVAKLTVTYHTGKYNEDTNVEYTINKAVEIIAIDKDPVVNKDLKYQMMRLTNDFNNAASKIDWNKANTDSNEVYRKTAVEEEFFMYVYLENSIGEDVTQEDEYTLESSNNDVLIVGYIGDNNSKKGVYAELIPVGKAGSSAFVLVKNKDEVVVKAIPVIIREERKFATFTTDPAAVQLSNSISLDSTDSYTKKEISLKLNDQYGGDLFTKSYMIPDVKITLISPKTTKYSTDENVIPANGLSDTTTYGYSQGKINFYGTESNNGLLAIPAGTYQYSIVIGNVRRVINVVIKAPTGTPSYDLVVTSNRTDLQVNGDSKDNINITVKIGVFKNGTLEKYLTLEEAFADGKESNISVKNGGTTLTANRFDEYTVNFNVRNVNADAPTVSGSSVSGSVVAKMPTGTYTIDAKLTNTASGLTNVSGSGRSLSQKKITITDGQTMFTSKVESKSVPSGTWSDIVKAAIDFYQGSDKIDDINIEIIQVKSIRDDGSSDPNVALVTARDVYISSVVFYKKENGLWVLYEVTVGSTITVR